MDFCSKVAEQFGLGELTAPPERVAGGFLHRMYRLETEAGKYALKVLNPAIMERPDAMENYRRAEEIERLLWKQGIPLIPALERDGRKMQCLEGQYYYLFTWSRGKALDWHQITEAHCRTIGKLLARIHKIPCQRVGREAASVSGQERNTRTDWDIFIEAARQSCPDIAEELEENRELLYLADWEYAAALDGAPDICCVSDGDMDCKNVLWADGEPLLIDLECLDYGNPFLEMFQLALSWAGGAVCEIDFQRFGGFLEAYQAEYGEMRADWNVISGIGYSWLDWLAYNVRRALGIECSDEEERTLGIREAHETIRRIRHYASVRQELVSYIAARRW